MLTYQFVEQPAAFAIAPLPGPFSCLVLVDQDINSETMLAICRKIIDAGCRYAMSWGRACEVWHDAFDAAAREQGEDEGLSPDKFVMTTWHNDESLEDVVFYAKRVAQSSSDDKELAGLIVIDFGSVDRSAQVRSLYECA